MAEGGGAVNLAAAAVARLDAPYRPAIVGRKGVALCRCEEVR